MGEEKTADEGGRKWTGEELGSGSSSLLTNAMKYKYFSIFATVMAIPAYGPNMSLVYAILYYTM